MEFENGDNAGGGSSALQTPLVGPGTPEIYPETSTHGMIMLPQLAENYEEPASESSGKPRQARACEEEGDLTEAFQWYLEAAAEEEEIPEAQYKVGACYRYGIGVQKNLKDAVFWFSKAADMGHAGAQFELGRCLEHGLGTKTPHKDRAFKLYAGVAANWESKAQGILKLKFLKKVRGQDFT
jgi:TPR repeat protein